MAITLPTVAQMVATTIDNHLKGQAFEQMIQEKPLLKILRRHQKKFGGGVENLTVPVKGTHSVTLQSYSGLDTVTYDNPNNVKRAKYNWKELHIGIGVTLTELKRQGIHVIDSTAGLEGNVSRSSDRDAYVLTDILEDKLSDMTESWVEGFNGMLWADGTGNTGKDIMGIVGLLSDPTGTPTAADATTGTFAAAGGIDPATDAWWKHRFAFQVPTATANGGALAQFLQREIRQLRRYGGKPQYALCGSAFLDALEIEMRANGYYTDSGFNKDIDIAMGSLKYQGIEFMYDPTMDDIGTTRGGAGILASDYSKRCYLIDPSALRLRPMDGEDLKRHAPARPDNQYVAYAAATYTGSMDMTQRNAHGVYQLV